MFDSLDIAGDNAECLYRQLANRFPQMKITFLLSRNCKDWNRLLADKFNLCAFEDANLKQVFSGASFILWSKNFPKMSSLANYREKSIFLGHGVTSEISHDDFYFKEVSRFSKYVCCVSEEEANCIRNYSDNKLIPIVCGYPRHDELLRKFHSLENKAHVKTVFISFHWRLGLWKDDGLFAKSSYLSGIRQFLNDCRLKKFVESGTRVLFLPHHMFENRLGLFDVPSYIEIPNMPFQDILIQSDVFITDFSSNTFEMALMNKPSLAYIPDRKIIEGFDRYNISRIESYPNICLCDTLDDVFGQLYNKLHMKSDNNFSRRIFKYVDGENTGRLINWMQENKLNGGN